MKIKGRIIIIHAKLEHIKYIDTTKLARALRKHIDWSKSSSCIGIPYKYDTQTKVYVDVEPEYVEVYF